jgi:alpha-aminoadipic semialdehyde synthase
VSWLVNGIYWEPKYPRVLTKNALRKAHEAGENRLMGVCDISADYEGSIEFTSEFTSIEEPFLLWDVEKEEFRRKIGEADNNCILFHSVDHLPAEMPKEASGHFGSKLLEFVKATVESDISKPFEEQANELPPEIYNAIITCQGKLTPNYEYIAELRRVNEQIADAIARRTPDKKSGV